jgi:hypothetical protein
LADLRRNLADAMASTATPYGIVSEGVEANQIMADLVYGGPSALSRIDRDILDLPGLTNVVLYEGLEDVLHSTTSDNLTANGYAQLLNYLQANNITVIALGLSPCDGYTGGGSSPNDPCTGTVDAERTSVNAWLSNYPLGLGPWSTPPLFYIDADDAIGVPDTSNGETRLNPTLDQGDHVNLKPDGFGALSLAYLAPQDTWQLADGVAPDGTVDPTVTVAADTASNANNPYLLNNPNTGQNPATVAGGATWTNDATRGGVLTFDGTTDYAATTGPVINTAGSFSIAAWVNMTGQPAGNAVIVAQNGTVEDGFRIEYNQADDYIDFVLPAADISNSAQASLQCGSAHDGWLRIVATYNAADHTASCLSGPYGDLMDYITGVTTFSASGPYTMGRGLHNGSPTDYFPGSISDLRVWNYALSGDQAGVLCRSAS